MPLLQQPNCQRSPDQDPQRPRGSCGFGPLSKTDRGGIHQGMNSASGRLNWQKANPIVLRPVVKGIQKNPLGQRARQEPLRRRALARTRAKQARPSVPGGAGGPPDCRATSGDPKGSRIWRAVEPKTAVPRIPSEQDSMAAGGNYKGHFQQNFAPRAKSFQGRHSSCVPGGNLLAEPAWISPETPHNVACHDPQRKQKSPRPQSTTGFLLGASGTTPCDGDAQLPADPGPPGQSPARR